MKLETKYQRTLASIYIKQLKKGKYRISEKELYDYLELKNNLNMDEIYMMIDWTMKSTPEEKLEIIKKYIKFQRKHYRRKKKWKDTIIN